MPDGLDVERMAERAERLGIVTPDLQGAVDGYADPSLVVVIHLSGGMLADVGVSGPTPARIVVVDDDVREVGGEDVWSRASTPLDGMDRGILDRIRDELPPELAGERTVDRGGR